MKFLHDLIIYASEAKAVNSERSIQHMNIQLIYVQNSPKTSLFYLKTQLKIVMDRIKLWWCLSCYDYLKSSFAI